MADDDYHAVLAFWFADEVKPRWFNATSEFDQVLTEQYLPLWQAAKAGQLEHWGDSAEGALALVIILDQFPLHMFRARPESFATEAQSREIANGAIARGFDQALNDQQKVFLYMPFMHSEDLIDQDRSVELYTAAGMQDNAKWARHHRDIVKRFGRFPHRNKILGRDSNAEEIAYLNSDAAFSG